LLYKHQILLISGSVRQYSYTYFLTEAIAEALRERGVTTSHWNLGKKPLPIADPAFHSNPTQHFDSTVRELVKIATVCDAFVFASPIYHNSYSGVLKNALDFLTINHFQNKPVGLLGHGGNRSTQAVDHLRIVVRGLLGVAIPTQICTAQQDYDEVGGNNYKLKSEDILQRIQRFTSELTVFAYMLQHIRLQSNS
jgi:NAD(P)H-dependent FMN reductase